MLFQVVYTAVTWPTPTQSNHESKINFEKIFMAIEKTKISKNFLYFVD